MRNGGVNRRALLGAALAVPGLAVLTACGPGGGADAGLRVRIGHQKNGILLLTRRSGRLDEALRAEPAAAVSWLEFPSGPPLLEALAVNSIDLGATGDAPPVFAQAAGTDLVYAAAVPLSGRAGGVLVQADSPLQSVADLRGKRVAYARGTSAHNAAAEMLEAAGLSLSDITEVNLAAADAQAAFAQGGIDAWVIWDPFFTSARLAQNARVLEGTSPLPRSNAFILATRAFAEGQPALLSRVLDTLRAESAWAAANRPEVARMMAAETGLPEALLADTVQRDDFDLVPVSPEIVARQQTIADRFARLGLIPAAVNVSAATWTGWTPA